MAKFQFGVSQEDIEKEQAAKQQELEAEIRDRVLRRNNKLSQLNKKTKRNKITIMIIAILFFVAMLVFGTYNTFFKQTLDKKDVTELIAQQTASLNTDGIEGFLHDNIVELFSNYGMVSNAEYDYASIEPDSLRINKLVPVTKDTAIVIFSANFKSKKQDSVVKKDGTRQEELVLGADGYTRYQFRLVLQYTDKGGYKPVSQLSLSPLGTYDSIEIEESDLLSFNDIEKLKDEAVLNDMQLKVDRILADLYAGKDPGADYGGKVLFEAGQEYKGINEFTVYADKNALGYNSYITYTVMTKDGVEFANSAYLSIVKNGDSYKIESFL